MRAHHDVLVEEPREPVRADTPDERGEVDDDVGLGIAEQPRGVVLSEVVIGAAGDVDLVACGLEPLDKM